MSDLGCSSNAAIAFDFLVGKGLRDFQAAAVVGNLQQESHIDPRLEATDTNGLPGRGIAMWQPPRWQRLLAFAAGRDPQALDTQLDFLWHELQADPSLGLAQLLAAATLEDATVTFQNRFERPQQTLAATQSRITYARGALLACPAVRPPPRRGAIAATVTLLALVGAAGYGIYKALAARRLELPLYPSYPIYPRYPKYSIRREEP